MRLSGQFLIFFLRKILQHEKRKTSNFYSLKSFSAQKNFAFCFIHLFLVGFCLFWVFYAARFFLQKIRNCPDNLIYCTTCHSKKVLEYAFEMRSMVSKNCMVKTILLF